MEYSELYDRTIQYLQKYGWTQNSIGTENEPACIRGAMNMVTMGTTFGCDLDAKEESQRCLSLKEIIEEHFPSQAEGIFGTSPAGVVTSFNDNKETTFEDVILVLEKARANS
jgi:hypothetical protein